MKYTKKLIKEFLICIVKNLFIIMSLIFIFTIIYLYTENKPETEYHSYSEFLKEWHSPDVFPSRLSDSAENIKYKYDAIHDFKCISFTLNEEDFNECYSDKYVADENQKETFEIYIKPYITDSKKIDFNDYYFNIFDIKEHSISGIIVNSNNNNVIIFYIKT